MKARNQLRVRTHAVQYVAAWAVALGLTIGTGTGHAQTRFIWTNTTASGLWQDTTAWNQSPLVPGPTDSAYFTNQTTYYVTLNADVAVGSITFSNNPSRTPTVTLDLGGNSLLAAKADPVNGFLLDVADRGGTDIVYIASTTGIGQGLFLTNSAGNGKTTLGRNGMAIVFVTNGNVTANQVILGNGSSSQNSRLVLSGASTYWTNTTKVQIGNNASSLNNSLVISNGATMNLSSSSVQVGYSSGNDSLLLDSNGRLFTGGASQIGNGNNTNTATVQGGAIWNNGNGALTVGGGGGTGNLLTIGTGSTVGNISTATVSAANTLNLQGGLLQSATNLVSGTLKGFGSIAGNTIINSGGLLTPGSSIGAIVFSNDLTLAATALMELDKLNANGSNDFVNVFGTLTMGGTLTVTNIGAALIAGDTFRLFAFTSQSGDFAVTNLPSLNTGLSWDTSQLDSRGTIDVIPEPSTLVLVGAALGLMIPAIRRRRR